ncbi:hypothetical protein ATANTOWER_019509 [Ataeniobius toweri]|uniref:Uncharacterized protein n=1 Tax=Ataeniobius toweri TaxID=208326 RepID=A0ABU7BUQ2_9TELE|nr:hypothetical protein [Ataeniobius toweri]
MRVPQKPKARIQDLQENSTPPVTTVIPATETTPLEKAGFVKCSTNSCPVSRFCYLSCGSLQLLQSYHGPCGCFSI